MVENSQGTGDREKQEEVITVTGGIRVKEVLGKECKRHLSSTLDVVNLPLDVLEVKCKRHLSGTLGWIACHN